MKNELFYLEDKDVIFKFVLLEVFVNDFYYDYEGNLWVSIEGKGMFLLVLSEVRLLEIIREKNFIV